VIPSSEETYPILGYDKCVALMETVRDPQAGRPVYGPHTRLVQGWGAHGATYAIRYHETDVVTYHADGTVTLNAGDRRAQDARNRFTYYCPFVISKEKGKWGVWTPMDSLPQRNAIEAPRLGGRTAKQSWAMLSSGRLRVRSRQLGPSPGGKGLRNTVLLSTGGQDADGSLAVGCAATRWPIRSDPANDDSRRLSRLLRQH